MKKKKKSLKGLSDTVEAVKKQGVDTLTKTGIATAAVLAGSAGAALVPEIPALQKVPAIGPYLSKSAPGIVLITSAAIVGWKMKGNEKAQVAALGLAIAGGIDILRRNGVLSMINQKIQTGLNGLRGIKGPVDQGAASQLGKTVDTSYQVMSSQLLS